MKNKVKPTEKQKLAVMGILQGKSARRAMIDAKYTEVSASHPKQNLIDRPGVQSYVAKLDKASKAKFGISLESKMIDTTLEGLEATKLFGKDAVKHPDWGSRYNFLKLVSDVTGKTKSSEPTSETNQQYNFFQVNTVEREAFHNKLKEFLRKNNDKE